jgi:D-alanine--poly(phosphoribitol) ligase subunit 2
VNDDADIARTVQIFEDALNVDAPAPDIDIIESRLIDSLGLVTLIYEIEQEFGVKVPLESLDVEDFRTIANIVRMVRTLLREAPA